MQVIVTSCRGHFPAGLGSLVTIAGSRGAGEAGTPISVSATYLEPERFRAYSAKPYSAVKILAGSRWHLS